MRSPPFSPHIPCCLLERQNLLAQARKTCSIEPGSRCIGAYCACMLVIVTCSVNCKMLISWPWLPYAYFIYFILINNAGRHICSYLSWLYLASCCPCSCCTLIEKVPLGTQKVLKQRCLRTLNSVL